jgi:hypothetical protein
MLLLTAMRRTQQLLLVRVLKVRVLLVRRLLWLRAQQLTGTAARPACSDTAR